jgi:hypothetical protein
MLGRRALFKAPDPPDDMSGSNREDTSPDPYADSVSSHAIRRSRSFPVLRAAAIDLKVDAAVARKADTIETPLPP